MDEIAACGFAGLHSLQPSAGIDISVIKKRYGKDFVLVGNIDLDYVMTMAAPDEVAEVVMKTIDAAAPGAGFILSTCNTPIQAVPPADALAIYETAHRYGVYGRGRLSTPA